MSACKWGKRSGKKGMSKLMSGQMRKKTTNEYLRLNDFSVDCVKKELELVLSEQTSKLTSK